MDPEFEYELTWEFPLTERVSGPNARAARERDLDERFARLSQRVGERGLSDEQIDVVDVDVGWHPDLPNGDKLLAVRRGDTFRFGDQTGVPRAPYRVVENEQDLRWPDRAAEPEFAVRGHGSRKSVERSDADLPGRPSHDGEMPVVADPSTPDEHPSVKVTLADAGDVRYRNPPDFYGRPGDSVVVRSNPSLGHVYVNGQWYAESDLYLAVSSNVRRAGAEWSFRYLSPERVDSEALLTSGEREYELTWLVTVTEQRTAPNGAVALEADWDARKAAMAERIARKGLSEVAATVEVTDYRILGDPNDAPIGDRIASLGWKDRIVVSHREHGEVACRAILFGDGDYPATELDADEPSNVAGVRLYVDGELDFERDRLRTWLGTDLLEATGEYLPSDEPDWRPAPIDDVRVPEDAV